ncbi:MAG: hypothetical protein LPK19_08430 [Hymenobacteraceae bacterium]|nr:hypothetical protein [Hymenobacteraceae bacterium]MDX5396240.1 hypothetical protein [Hymenobacteraceae bacterium]MDX5512303.1 hypothetical protein [Hymenobacteraceae bacterium]
MKKLVIELSDEQYQTLKTEISKGMKINFDEETFSGFSITLSVIEGNLSWLEFEMYGQTNLGDVDWRFE